MSSFTQNVAARPGLLVDEEPTRARVRFCIPAADTRTTRTPGQPGQPATGRDDVAFSLLEPIVARREIRLLTGLHFRLTTCPTFRASSRDPLRDPGAEHIVTVEFLLSTKYLHLPVVQVTELDWDHSDPD